MFARICLLVLLVVAMATQGTALAGADAGDQQAERAELGIEEAVLVLGIELAAPAASPAPPLVTGTEVVHASPPSGRVFRPPRVAFG